MVEYRNRSVDRALNILEVLLSSTHGLLLADIAERADLDRVTTFRLLRVLADRGYIFQDTRSKRYSLMVNSAYFRSKGELSAIAARLGRPLFQQLHSEIGTAVNIASYEGATVFYRRVSLGGVDQGVDMQCSMLPSHATALGKVLLAFRPQSEVRKVYEYIPLQRYTPLTIRDLAELERELETIRERGYAVSECELNDDIFCVAVPVETQSKNCMLAISTCRPAKDLGTVHMERLIDTMRHTAAMIESTVTGPQGVSQSWH